MDMDVSNTLTEVFSVDNLRTRNVAHRHGMGRFQNTDRAIITQDNGKMDFAMASASSSNAAKMVGWCQELQSTSCGSQINAAL